MCGHCYIDTLNATRPLAQVYAEIDNYEAWYRPDGLFLDNADQAASSVPYLTSVRDYMRSKMQRPTTLVLNVGIWPDKSYANVADIMSLEATYADWSTRGQPQPGSRLCRPALRRDRGQRDRGSDADDIQHGPGAARGLRLRRGCRTVRLPARTQLLESGAQCSQRRLL